MKLKISLAIIFLIFATSAFSADLLTKPIAKTATKYEIRHVGFSFSGKEVLIDVELQADDGSLVDRKVVKFGGADYPQNAADSLLNAVKKALTAKGIIN